MGFLEEGEMEPVRRKRTTLLEYVEALEEERRKMIVFHRELPYSLDLVSRALESYRLQLELSSEQVDKEGPVLKEFLPTKTEESKDLDEEREEERSRKLPEWLRVAKVADPRRDSPSPPPPAKVESKNTKMVPASEVSTAISTAEVSGSGGRGRVGSEEKGGHRKVRRCWSPELHRRFLQALQQLGGSHVATPKQIRELMKVDGLSNDEVKSHLQKYRLHTRRGSPPVQASSPTNNAQASQHQMVLIGGIWPPPSTGSLDSPVFPTGATRAEQSSLPLNRVYAPVASIPLQQQDKSEKVISPVEEQSVDGSRSNSDSSVTTTTTTTTTATTWSHTITATGSPPN